MAEKEYIEREAAIDEVLMGNIDKDFPRMDIAARLHDIPAEDVRPVVMCGECKHYQGVHNCKGHAPCDYWGIGGVLWNDFCSRGVKMEES